MNKAVLLKTWIEEDRVKRNVTIVDVPQEESKHLQFIYDALDVKTVDVAYVSEFDAWVDDEGLLKSDTPVFSYGSNVHLAGNVLLSKGVGSRGETLWFDNMEDTIHAVDLLEKGELRGVTQ